MTGRLAPFADLLLLSLPRETNPAGPIQETGMHLRLFSAAIVLAGAVAARIIAYGSDGPPDSQRLADLVHEQHSRSEALPPQTRGLAERLMLRLPSANVRGDRPVEMVLVTSIARVASSPEQFSGVRVSVHARIATYLGPHLFTLSAGDWSGRGTDLIVVLPKPTQQADRIGEGDGVAVVGTVRPLDLGDIPKDNEVLSTFPDIAAELAGRPLLVAEAAHTPDGLRLTRAAEQLTYLFVAESGEIADMPWRFYGRSVSVRVDVENVISPRAFTVDQDEWFTGPDIVVFNPSPAASIGNAEGTAVTVVGIVRPFIPSEFEADYTWFEATDYPEATGRGYRMRPAIVASSIATGIGELVRFHPDLALDVLETKIASRADEWSAMDDRPRQHHASDWVVSEWLDLVGAKPEDLIGRPVRLDCVKVLRMIDARTLLVGPSLGQAVLLETPEVPERAIEAGGSVRLEGVLRPTPQNARFRQHTYYIKAVTLSLVESSPHSAHPRCADDPRAWRPSNTASSSCAPGPSEWGVRCPAS